MDVDSGLIPMLQAFDRYGPNGRWERLTERDRAIAVRWFRGDHVMAIAAEFGISRPRIQQIVKPLSLPRFRKLRVEWVTCVCGSKYQRAPGHKAVHVATPDHFWRQVLRGDGCWEWQGNRDPNGYGSFRNTSAHRQAWTLTNGPIPDGLFICHHCDNPPCVRPDHLFAGTARDNAQDRNAKGRDLFSRGFVPIRPSHERTHCIHGHEYTPANTIPGTGGSRACRQCALDRSNARRARKRAETAA